MKPRTLAVLCFSLSIASSRGAVGQKLEDLPLHVQAEVETTLEQIALMSHLYQRIERDSRRADPNLQQARRADWSRADVERATVRRAIQADANAFAEAGRGDKALFEDWQTNYAQAIRLEMFAELLQDQTLRGIILDHTRLLLLWITKEDPSSLTDELLIARFEECMAESVVSSRCRVATIELLIAPTELQREHVRREARQRWVEEACRYYYERHKPRELEVLLDQMHDLHNRLATLWPAWNATDERTLRQQEVAFALMLHRGLW